MGKQPHIVAVPYPANGHVTPLLKLCHKIASQGIKVTFVNTEFIHSKLIHNISPHGQTSLTFASIPDGLEHDDDREDFVKLTHSIRRFMSVYLGDLIQQINQSDEAKPVTCILADAFVGWIMDVAEKLGIETVGFIPVAPSDLALILQTPELMEAGIMDSNGNLTKVEQIRLSKEIPARNNVEFTWSVPGDPVLQKLFFEACCLTCKSLTDRVDWLLCSSFYEVDPESCNLIPKILTVGPLLISCNAERSAYSGSLWLEDESCLSWLDRQEVGSVVYVAFGSTAVFSQEQFEELALGIEQSGKAFLWVVRSNFVNGLPCNTYPEGFLDRVADRGKIVEWAPQEKVLAHPSVACFFSHCGWNSTLEGMSQGVPFLCWPYFGDQFYNQRFICEFWKVGLNLNPSGNGIRSRNEICEKIEDLISDELIRVNALRLKDLAQISISPGGSSFKNLERFINHLKG